MILSEIVSSSTHTFLLSSRNTSTAVANSPFVSLVENTSFPTTGKRQLSYKYPIFFIEAEGEEEEEEEEGGAFVRAVVMSTSMASCPTLPMVIAGYKENEK
tara:strand:- start:1455 stop:1757 length:303 start_codon:yes stop_codon:yes gene_type:complete